MTVYHRILANDRRRIAIEVLGGQRESLTLRELAETIADHTDDGEARRIRIQLHHKHLPLLHDVGVIDYDMDRTLITPNPPVLAEVIEVSDGQRRPSPIAV